MEIECTEIACGIRSGDYSYLGRGSGRRVYDLGNGYVVKSALCNKGFAQNLTEYFIWGTSKDPILAEISGASSDFRCLLKRNKIIIPGS
jgi:hypothetical protein